MNKYVRVMDGLKSNASVEVFKIDETITAKNWNPNAKANIMLFCFNKNLIYV